MSSHYEYSVVVFNYDNKEAIVLYTNSKRNCLSYQEDYISKCIYAIEGSDKKFEDYITIKKPYASKYDYKTCRVFISKSINNPQKLTLNKIVKDSGYLFNEYRINKIVSVNIVKRLVKDDFIPIIQRFEDQDLFHHVLEELCDKFEESKNINIYNIEPNVPPVIPLMLLSDEYR